jgi:oligopeptidase B
MPAAKKIAKKLVNHDDVRIDNYFWMNKRDSKAVLDYLKAENANTKKVLKPTEGLQKKLIKEMRARIKEDETSAPTPHPPYFYYTRYVKGGEYPVIARKKDSLKAKEEVLVDGNKLGKGKKYFQIGGLEESTDQRYIGYATDTVGRRFYDLYFRDTKTGKLLKDVIKKTTGNFVWANDNKTIYYVSQDPKTLRANRLFRYELGSKKKPTLVYDEKDETYSLGIEKGRSERWLFLSSTKRDSSEVRFFDLHDPKGEWQLFYPRQTDFEYQLDDGGEEFFILTNWKAPNNRLMKSPARPTAKEKWEEIIPHDEKVFIDNIDVYKNFLALQERANGLTQISVLNRAKIKGRELKFPDPTYVVELMGLPIYDSPAFRFRYNSLTRPPTVFEENFETGQREVIKTKEIPTYDFEKYESRRLWATAKDGTKIPISMLMKKGTALDGKSPLLLDGYGSYGLSNDPEFHREIISLVDRGFVYAIAHIRGGGEMGRHWYDEGRLKKKINTFTDFITCGEFLSEQKYTSPEHLYAWGGSAGGLLMGAVINMRPDLFHGVIAAVPFVDVVTTMLDESVPLTTSEYREWGDPRQKDDYFYMKSYSPYDNVKAQAYPNLLVTTGYHDSQVQYWEPMKWVAKLRELKADDHLLLLYTDMGSGHSGASGRFQALNDTAREYAFYLMLEGKTK